MTSAAIVPCIWCDNNAGEAAELYLSVFPGSREISRTHYGPMQPQPEGTLLTVELELLGLEFVLLNGGPQFKHSEAISFQVLTDGQAETDRYWDELGAGGSAGPCGWLKDRFGMSWQIVPREVLAMTTDPDPARRARALSAMFQMSKLDIEAMRTAADDESYEPVEWDSAPASLQTDG